MPHIFAWHLIIKSEGKEAIIEPPGGGSSDVD